MALLRPFWVIGVTYLEELLASLPWISHLFLLSTLHAWWTQTHLWDCHHYQHIMDCLCCIPEPPSASTLCFWLLWLSAARA